MAVRETIQRAEAGPAAAVLPRAVAGTIGVAAFMVMTALGAQVRIPLPWTPVPITLQTFFVALAGATLGPVLGPLSQVAYLGAGAAGLPFFAGGGSGFAYLFGASTAGYLIGFPLATAITGRLVRLKGDPTALWILFSMAAGSLVIYGCGAWWLIWGFGLSLPSAVAKGVVPFLVGDALKTCGAAGLYRSYRRHAQILFP